MQEQQVEASAEYEKDFKGYDFDYDLERLLEKYFDMINGDDNRGKVHLLSMIHSSLAQHLGVVEGAVIRCSVVGSTVSTISALVQKRNEAIEVGQSRAVECSHTHNYPEGCGTCRLLNESVFERRMREHG